MSSDSIGASSLDAVRNQEGNNVFNGYDTIYVVFMNADNTCFSYGAVTLRNPTLETNYSEVIIDGFVNVLTANRILHELAHGMGLDHAEAYCGTYTSYLGQVDYFNSKVSCDAEYDISSSYSDGYGEIYNAANLSKLGWLTGANVTDVTSAGDYDIYPYEVSSSLGNSPRLLRVPRSYSYDGSIAEYYYLDLYVGQDNAITGVNVRSASAYMIKDSVRRKSTLMYRFANNCQSFLLCETSGEQVSVDPNNLGFKVTLTSISPEKATVHIEPTSAPVLPDSPIVTTARGNGAVSLSWTTPPSSSELPIIGYRVEYKLSSGLDPESDDYSPSDSNWKIWSVSGTSTTTNVTGLTNGSAYDFRVFAVNANGYSPFVYADDKVSATPLASVPTTPTNLIATLESDGRVNVSWDAPVSDGGSPITGYYTGYRLLPEGSSFACGTDPDRTSWCNFTTPVVGTSRSFSGLTLGETYSFHIRAINANGNSLYYAVNYTLPSFLSPAPGLPSVPTDLTASINGEGKVALSWAAPANNGGSPVTGYRFSYKDCNIDGDSWHSKSPAPVSDPATSGYFASLSVEGVYRFRVSADNNNGNGAGPWFETECVTLSNTPTVPSAPTNLKVIQNGDSYILNWGIPAYDGGSPITRYRVERKLSSGESFACGSNPAYAAWCGNWSTDPSFNISVPVNTGEAYDFRVYAENANGISPYSAIVTYPTNRPSAPTNLIVGINSAGKATLSWDVPDSDGGSPITGYVGSFQSCDMLPDDQYYGNSTSSTTVSFDGVAIGSNSYRFRARAINGNGNGPYSAETECITLHNTPTNLAATPTSKSSVSLSWNAPISNESTVTGYRVEYRASGSMSWMSTNVGVATTTEVTGLESGTIYHFRVSAIGTGVDNAASAEAIATTSTVPTPPINVTATIDIGGAVNISWDVPAYDGGSPITGYYTGYRLLPEGSNFACGTNPATTSWCNFTTPVTGTSRSFSGLILGETYSFRIRTINANGNSAYYTINYTLPSQPSTVLPTAPTNLTTGINAQNRATLSWDVPSSDGGSPITRYSGQYKLCVDGVPTGNWLGNSTTATTVSFSGTNLALTYTFRARAENANGTGPFSAETGCIALSGPSSTVPAAPTITNLIPGDGQVTVSWEAPAHDGSPITGYKIQYSTDENFESYSEAVVNSSDVTTIDDLSYIIAGLQADVTYYFRIHAINAAGNGEWSPIDSAVPYGKPDAPAITTTMPDDKSVVLTWAIPNDHSSTILSYKLQYSTTSDFAAHEEVSIPAEDMDDPEYEVTGLTNGTTYYFRLAALNAAGTGDWSEIKTACPRDTDDPGDTGNDKNVPDTEQSADNDMGVPNTGIGLFMTEAVRYWPSAAVVVAVIGVALVRRRSRHSRAAKATVRFDQGNRKPLLPKK
jgi:titin